MCVRSHPRVSSRKEQSSFHSRSTCQMWMESFKLINFHWKKQKIVCLDQPTSHFQKYSKFLPNIADFINSFQSLLFLLAITTRGEGYEHHGSILTVLGLPVSFEAKLKWVRQKSPEDFIHTCSIVLRFIWHMNSFAANAKIHSRFLPLFYTQIHQLCICCFPKQYLISHRGISSNQWLLFRFIWILHVLEFVDL